MKKSKNYGNTVINKLKIINQGLINLVIFSGKYTVFDDYINT